MSDSEGNVALVRRAFEAWAAGTGGVFDLLADDATWTIIGRSPVSRTYAGRRAFLESVVRPLNARLATPIVPRLHALYHDGDTVIARFEASATARDGRPYTNTYAWFLTIRDGRIVDATAFLDLLELTDLWERVPPG